MARRAADPPAGSGNELVEWVDEHDRVIAVVTRARMRAENLRHRSACVVVLSVDGQQLLIHRRSDSKDLLPGWWDVCAGGVLGVGESYADAARREAAEEIGLVGVDLRFLGAGRCDTGESREISHVFVARHDGPFTFADGEVEEACFVGADALRAKMQTTPFLPSCAAMVLPLVPGFEPDGSGGAHPAAGHVT